MFKHDENNDLARHSLESGLSKLIDRATDFNIMSHDYSRVGNTSSAMYWSHRRDALLDAYYYVTGIEVDYQELENRSSLSDNISYLSTILKHEA